METNLSADKARERKLEIRSTFARMVRTAADEGVEAILIAGDLFDAARVTKSTENYVLDLIASYPMIDFYYLSGNHDKGSALTNAAQLPTNLYTFGKVWSTYRRGNLAITGAATPDADTLSLNKDDVNILLLHGQERRSAGVAGEDIIHLGRFKNKNIDYAALGHVHEHRVLRLDARGIAAYSGCLEGRGFDECGIKGYVLLNVEGGRVSHRFVPFATRTLHTVACDVTGFTSALDLEQKMLASVGDIPTKDMVKVILTGTCSADATLDLAHLRGVLAEKFYFAKVKDETRLSINAEDYAHDISLKGEFVRRVMASSLSESEKQRVIACGFRALSGEELGL
jgi:DNA repair exonuclease SbcCD nuclease subunit